MSKQFRLLTSRPICVLESQQNSAFFRALEKEGYQVISLSFHTLFNQIRKREKMHFIQIQNPAQCAGKDPAFRFVVTKIQLLSAFFASKKIFHESQMNDVLDHLSREAEKDYLSLNHAQGLPNENTAEPRKTDLANQDFAALLTQPHP